MKSSFIVVLSHHRILGPIFAPFIADYNTGKEFFKVQEKITLKNLSKYESELDSDEISLVKTIEEYNDTELTKLFSKKKVSTQEFISGLDESILNSQVRPYIEKRLIRCIDILQGSDVSVYHKQNQNNIYESERIKIIDDMVESVFNFKYINSELSYFLSISHNENEIKLYKKQGIILSNEPCRLVLEDSLYIFNDIDGKKLQPFFNKEYIIVPQRAEKKFLESFVRNVIRTYKVKAEGFTIKDINVRPVPLLILETDLSGKPVFILKFKYDEETQYFANKKSELKVTYQEENQNKVFTRHNRNYNFENEVIISLLELGLRNNTGAYFLPAELKKDNDSQNLYSLINWLNFNSDELSKAGITVVQDSNKSKYYLKKIDLDIKISEEENDWFDINIVVKLADYEFKFIHFRNYIIENNREFKLPDGSIVILPEEWFSRFKDILKFVHAKDETLSLEKQHLPLLQESLKGIQEGYAKKIRKIFDFRNESQNELPSGIEANLRPYQNDGYNWMVNLYKNDLGGCLADDMGLGKTLQTLALLKKVIEEEKLSHYGPVQSEFSHQLTIFDVVETSKVVHVKPSLIVVPTSLVFNWVNETQRFVPSLKIAFYGGNIRKPVKYYYDNFDIIITSYGIIRNEIESFKNFEFLYVILDESQVVKNPVSKTYKALLQVKSENKLLLTGTPIENSLTDLWAQMNFVNPGLLGSLEFFKNEFLIPIERYKNEEKSKKLKLLISPFIMRRTKQEVAKDLPDLNEQTIYCDMSDVQYKYYENEKSKARNLIIENINKNGVEKSSIIILQSLTKLRQIANHPVMVDEDFIYNSGKFDEITRNLQNIVAEGHKALVFSSFVKHLELFSDFCLRNNIPFSMLTGETSNRGEKVKQFQENEEVRIFLISIKAGGFGLNLTAADYVFLLDPWWNPAVEQQALSRAHRLGQKKNVFVYRFIAKDTIEEKILKLQEKKSQLADAFVNNNPFKGSNQEEIMELFS